MVQKCGTECEHIGLNRHLDLLAAIVNLYHMQGQYDWAKGRLDDALLRFGNSVQGVEEQGSLFSKELRRIHLEKLSQKDDETYHKLENCWNPELIVQFENLLNVIGYGYRGADGFFYRPDVSEEHPIEKAVREGWVYNKKALYVTESRCFLSPKMFGVKNPFTRMADNLEQKTRFIKEQLERHQK